MGGMNSPFRVDLSDIEWRQTIAYVAAVERQFEGLVDEVLDAPSHPPSADHDLSPKDYLMALRRYRAGASIRALWQEMTGQITIETMGQTLSDIASQCLSSALADSERETIQAQGHLMGIDGQGLQLSVIGMGKLGGRELNFNSDIDVVLTYRCGGQADGRRGLDAGQYLSQVARGLIARLDTVTEHGRVWAVDTRLRPFGASGALVWSLPAIEAYFIAEGRTWERYAWLKASHAAGDASNSQAVLETLRPFIYRRYRDYGIFDSLRSLHAKIDGQAQTMRGQQDIKRGPGGIRALEFLVQSLQLLEGGRTRVLQTPDFFGAVRALTQSQLLDTQTAQGMRDAYGFLRTLENRLQAMTGRQTHQLPDGPEEQERLAQLMGFANLQAFWKQLSDHQTWVISEFNDRFIEKHLGNSTPLTPSDITWPPGARLETSLIAQGLSSGQAGEMASAFEALHHRLSKRPSSAEGRQRLERLMPVLIHTLAQKPIPSSGLKDLLDLIETIAQRSAYLALLYERPEILEHVMDVFSASQPVSRWIIESPQLLDDLIDPQHQTTTPSAPRLDAKDLEHGLNELSRWRQTRFLKTALAELNQNIEIDEVGRALSEVAQTCIQNILDGIAPDAPLAVIGYGNLGANNLHYGSDLDCVFLHHLQEENAHVVRVAQRLITLMQLPLPGGRLFEIDTRLRPNGRAGLLVSDIERFLQYQQTEAWLWEHQALIRARWVAGDPRLAQTFESIRQEVLSQPRDRHETAQTLLAMRQKQKTERQESKAKERLTDIQFLAEWGVLTQAHHNEALIHVRSCPEQLALIDGIDSDLIEPLQASWRELTLAIHQMWLVREPSTLNPESLAQVDRLIAQAWQTIGC